MVTAERCDGRVHTSHIIINFWVILNPPPLSVISFTDSYCFKLDQRNHLQFKNHLPLISDYIKCERPHNYGDSDQWY